MRLLHEPIALWAEGQHEPPDTEGYRAIRCNLKTGPHNPIPMPSGREARHRSHGFGARVSMADGSDGFVLVAPVEQRFDHDALLSTVLASPHHGAILAVSPPDSVRPLATEWSTASQPERGRLRRLSFYVDRDLLESTVDFRFVRRYRASLVHIRHEHQSFPVVARQLWLVPDTQPQPHQFTRRPPPGGP